MFNIFNKRDEEMIQLTVERDLLQQRLDRCNQSYERVSKSANDWKRRARERGDDYNKEKSRNIVLKGEIETLVDVVNDLKQQKLALKTELNKYRRPRDEKGRFIKS